VKHSLLKLRLFDESAFTKQGTHVRGVG